MSAIRILALSYLVVASAFVLAATLTAHPELARGIGATLGQAVRMVREDVVAPALELAHRQEAALLEGPDHPGVVRLTLTPPQVSKTAPAAPPDDRLRDPEFSASATITLLPDLSPESAPVPPEPKLARPEMPDAPVPDIVMARPVAPAIPAPPVAPLPPAQVATRGQAAALRLKSSLTPEMLNNFDLFIYVSTADRGPLAQRMLVFRKQDGGLDLLHDWAASTGREQNEISPRGRTSFTATPAGFYQLDPDRMYRRYHSWSWDQDMPYAMFFNWERRGLQTGLAIHAASGADIARLGARASAGCVHLAPENAQELYRLIRADYRGMAPRFAYNRRTETMSNQGDFQHDRDGNLRMADGYRVLVVIQNYSGSDILALN